MSRRYSAIAIGLHWAIAVLLVGNIFLAWNMEDSNHQPVEDLFQLHKSIGITVLFLSIARLIWRLLNPPPALPDDMKSIEKKASHFVHIVFYVAMIAIPLSGWILVSASKFSVSTVLFGTVSWPHLPFLPELSDQAKDLLYIPVEFIHSKFAWVVIILLGLHVAGAIKHQFAGEDGVLKRMIPGLFGSVRPPEPTRGAWMTFGTAIVLFLAIAAIPLLGSASTNADTATQASSESSDTNWVVDQDQSFIRFSGTHNGKDFEGEVEDWSAAIRFDQDDLDDASVKVTVSSGSVNAGQKLYNDTLRAREWLFVSEHPTLTVELTNFQESGDGYQADATISLKESELIVPFEFTLEDGDSGTVMTGSTTLDRTALNLGLSSDPDAKWVSQTIDIAVKVVASPVE